MSLYTLIYANNGIFFYISDFFYNKLVFSAIKSVKKDSKRNRIGVKYYKYVVPNKKQNL